MDKENGKGNDSSSGPSKVSSVQDPAAILDAASLFGAYWPRSDASTANLFAAASGFGLPPHAAAALPFGLLPAAAAAQGGRGGSSSSTSGGGTNLPPSYPASSTAAPSGAAAAAAAAYSNAAYSSTLSVAASQAASLGMPVASAAWWSMASHLAAQDYLARLQASGLNFPMGGPADPYAALGLPSLTGGGHHKSKSPSKSSRSSSNNKDKMAAAAAAASMGSSGSMKMDHHKLNSSISMSKTSSNNSLKYSSPSGLTIQPSVKLPGTNSSVSDSKSRKHSSDLSYLTKLDVKQKTSSASVSTPPAPITSSSTISSVTTTSCVKPPADSPSIYSNPMSLASNQDKGAMSILNSNSSHNSVVNSSSSGLPSSILSDPNSILGGVRLPPDTEIIKYTSSIVGPKIPGTTNRGRKKTISLDPPSVSVLPSHSSTGLSIERTLKRARLSDDDTPGGTSMSDRVEVIKLPATNGSPSGISSFNSSDGSGEAPLNLSLKPNYTTSGSTSSLNSLSNMSANIGSDRISRRKPGPKPRRVIPMESTPPPPSSTPNTILNQYFSGIDSPRPPSRNEGSDGGSSTSSTSAAPSGPSGTGGISIMNHKEGRPRNLGRGVSKPKKNTVASLLAQSRALGIKPVPMLDPNASMNQQMNLLKSNILAAQQYISEAGGDEKALNKFLQERFKGTLSDSSTVDASDSDNLTDSNHTDSEIETEIVAKKQKQYDERLLRVPLERGWKRETVIRGVTKNGGIRGDVSYAAPDSSNKFKQMSDITQYLEYQKSTELTKDNFTFSCRVIIGDYLQPVPPEMQTDGNEYIYLTEEDVTKRLEELRAAMRTSLPVEQRIEMAKKQQAARAAARLDREQQRLTKELERNERQEAARREREARSQQLLEAKRKRQEELEKQKQEEQHRKQQERELKRQQAAMLKEQIYIQEINKQREMLYTVELEKERRRQHLALIKAMESRRKLEEKEKRKQQLLAEKQANKEKKLEQRRVDLEILTELRKPCEDLELNQKPLPTYERIHGLKLSGKAFADTLMIFEFLHNFGETLGFDMDSLPTLDSIQQALVPNDHSYEAEEELFSVITHLLVCAIEDPGIPNPARHTTILGQSLRQADITHVNLSEILRIYLYANATGEVKALTGVHFERDREKRIADHHQTEDEMQQTVAGKNSHYYELLHENPTYKMSDLLKDKPFIALSPTDKAAILAFICNELLQNKAVTRQIENSLENMIQHKKEKWLLDQKIRKLKVVHSKKLRTEALEKSHNKSEMEEGALDSPHLLHKDDLLEDEEHEMSDNESVGTQPEEEEDAKLSGEELAKKLEKLSQTSENHLQTINTSMSQLRAVTFGEDRYFRRYWSLPRSGGIFVEAMESAEPEEFEEQSKNDQVENLSNGIRNLNELHSVIEKVEKIDDHADDKEVSSIVGGSDTDKESNIAIIKPQTNNNESEHRKTPNRLENGEITETHNLAELNKSVENIVQSLEERIEACKEEKLTESQLQSDINDAKNLDDSDSISNRKFNLFERLGQCMERENRTEEDLKAEVKAEVKEELKNEILKELKQEIKSEIKTELEENDEFKWFSILHKDGSTCDEVHLTAGNKWDNGNVGACTKDITELKIPVFPPPCSNSGMNLHHNCESPAPLQMTSEESVQLELIRKHGMPSSFEKKPVPFDQRYGWWRIKTLEQLREVLENLHVRGVRERELKRSFVINMQQMYNKGKLVIEEGCDELTKLSGENIENINFVVGDIPMPDVPGSWSKVIAHRVDMFLLEQVEALEDKVASASMQVKGWKIPERDTDDIPYGEVVNIIKNKLSSLEINIERRYLKPPLGVNTNIRSSTGSSQDSSFQSTTVESATSTPVISQQVPPPDDIPKGLGVWREAVNRASTSAQLAMCLYSLESSIAWDKSIMKAVSEPAEFSIQNARKYNSKLSNCQFCHSGDNEDKLLLCDSCDRGYHTYCFKPKMENIPEGDWYCHECMNKATGDRNCIVCGRKMSTTGTRLLVCELCPRAYHTDCIQPQIHKVPRGKWYCTNCFSKKPQKKPVKKNHTKPTKENESAPEQPPASPAPSHSSVTTNDDVPTTNCSQNSDVSNSSLTSGLINAGSPSTCAKKEKEKANKKLMKELTPCRLILEDLECHDDAWPFLLPVNTKQFPTYKKIIKIPMDLSTIKKRLQDLVYKSREEFCSDVRQIFNNCETFNEDDSPVGKAGHCMRQFFESRWNELCASHS